MILIIRRWNLLTRKQNMIPVMDQRLLMFGPVVPRRSQRNSPRKRQSLRRPSHWTLIAVNPRTCVGNFALNPQRKRLKSANASVLRNGHPICWVYTRTGSKKVSSRRVLLPMTSGTIPITYGRCYSTMSPPASAFILLPTC